MSRQIIHRHIIHACAVRMAMSITALFLGTLPARAQFAPGLTGQNSVLSVPTAGIGEQGRFAVTAGGVFGLNTNRAGLSSVSLGLNLTRTISVSTGIGFSNQPDSLFLHEQFTVGFRAVIFSHQSQSFWNLGVDADGCQDIRLDSNALSTTSGRARLLADLHLFSWFSLTGFAGYAVHGKHVTDLARSGRTVIEGGGVLVQPFPMFALLGEYSNSFFMTDPGVIVAMGGVRVFPFPSLSITAGYGRAWRTGEARTPLAHVTLSYSTGAMNRLPGGEQYTPATAPTAVKSISTSLAREGVQPVAITTFALQVQNDPQISRILTLTRPALHTTIYAAVDSAAFARECRLLALNSDTSNLLQVTGTESVSTTDDSSRLDARVAVWQAAIAAGVSAERILFRDQYSTHRTIEPIAYGMFLVRPRRIDYKEVLRVEARNAAASVDSISTALSQSTLNTKARITVRANDLDVATLRAAYALQDMMYSQSLFPSYAVEMTFRRELGEPSIIIETAP